MLWKDKKNYKALAFIDVYSLFAVMIHKVSRKIVKIHKIKPRRLRNSESL